MLSRVEARTYCPFGENVAKELEENSGDQEREVGHSSEMDHPRDLFHLSVFVRLHWGIVFVNDCLETLSGTSVPYSTDKRNQDVRLPWHYPGESAFEAYQRPS